MRVVFWSRNYSLRRMLVAKTLTLTSPPMRGMLVGRAQKLLMQNGYYVGATDAVFGEITARACSEAKYKLGYAAGEIKPTYGDRLDDYLSKRQAPSFVMRVRAKQRAKKQPLGEAVIRVARQYIGVKESPPNSNHVMFSDWYGIVGPWCAMFVTYCFVTAGSKAFTRGERFAYCPFVLDAAKHGQGMRIVPKHDAKKGDIVLFCWDGSGVPQHIGIVLTPVTPSGTFTTIEGNTGATSRADGGEVAVRGQDTSVVVAFVRVVK